MDIHEFTLYLRGAGSLDDAAVERLYRAGFDDASFGSVNGLDYAMLHRRGSSFGRTVIDAIRSLERALPGATVVAIAGDELVSASEIAARTGRTRESVRLLIGGRRGPGGFPPAASWVSTRRTRLYDWSEVASWFRSELGEDVPEDERAAFIAALNGALTVRHRAARLDRSSDREAVAEILREDAELLARG
ncbi:MAG: hypothetical protein GEU88_16865 [Solirubrobacterales bacterium]|nr:hypothetical protein [Solirubrobacterales bacterium]